MRSPWCLQVLQWLQLRRLMILGLSLLSSLGSSNCTLLPLHQLMRREVIMIQKGLIVGLLPMWIPENLRHAPAIRSPELFYDWIFRRQRIYTLKHHLDTLPVDLVLWSGLVSQAEGGVESELDLLSVDQRRPEVWQTLELTHSIPSLAVDKLSYRQFRVFAALMSHAAENFLVDERLPATVLWQHAQRASQAEDSSHTHPMVYPYSSYAVAAGFIYNNEALLVVLVHMLISSAPAYDVVSARILELMNKYPDYCVERLIIVGYMPGDQHSFQVAQSAEAQNAGQSKSEMVTALIDVSNAEAHHQILAPQGSQVRVDDQWLAELRSKFAAPTIESLLYRDAVRIELTHLPSCHPAGAHES